MSLYHNFMQLDQICLIKFDEDSLQWMLNFTETTYDF